MKRTDLASILVFVLCVGAVPLVTQSGVWLNFAMMGLYACLLAQSWNIVGGFGGQFSFGHALFFGTGAYAQAMLQVHAGWNPWLALPSAMLCSAAVGAVVGGLSFRYGLKGSYFALVTLAFAEVFRIVALSVPFTGAGVGMMLPLRESWQNMQFASRGGYVWLLLGMVTLALAVTAWLRASRFGAYLQAVRDNEDAARAVGVNPFDIKLRALALSGAFMGAASAAGWEVRGGCDIDPEAPSVLDGRSEVASLGVWVPPQADVVITNIPFSGYHDRISELRRIGQQAGARVVVTLARLTVLEQVLRGGR